MRFCIQESPSRVLRRVSDSAKQCTARGEVKGRNEGKEGDRKEGKKASRRDVEKLDPDHRQLWRISLTLIEL